MPCLSKEVSASTSRASSTQPPSPLDPDELELAAAAGGALSCGGFCEVQVDEVCIKCCAVIFSKGIFKKKHTSLSRMYRLKRFSDLVVMSCSFITSHCCTEQCASCAIFLSWSVPACGSASRVLCRLYHCHISRNVKDLKRPWP